MSPCAILLLWQDKLHLLEGVLADGAIVVLQEQLARGSHTAYRSHKPLTRGVGIGVALVEVVHGGTVELLDTPLIASLEPRVEVLQMRQESGKHLRAVEGSATLRSHRGGVGEVVGEGRLVDIQPYAHDGAREGVARECVLDKHTRNLSVAGVYVVGPLYAAHDVVLREGGNEGEGYNLGEQKLLDNRQKGGGENDGEGEIIPLGAMPRVSALPASRGLVLSPDGVQMAIARVVGIVVGGRRCRLMVYHGVKMVLIYRSKIGIFP